MRKYLFVFALFIPFFMHAQKDRELELNIVFVGNSITQGALLQHPEQEAPPVQTRLWLEKQVGIADVNIFNQGVSGMTTVDFLPANKTLFTKLKAAMETLKAEYPKGSLVFSIMLGTNDSANFGPTGAPISASQYYTNMKAIVDELLELFPSALFVLHRPIWYSPNTYNGAQYLASGLKRLDGYFLQLQELVSHYAEKFPKRVFMGDEEAFTYFEVHHQTDLIPEEGLAGIFYLHPNSKGAEKLAAYWGKAIYHVIKSKLNN